MALNHLQVLSAMMRAGADYLRQLSVAAPGKASVYERWADHLDEDTKSLLLLAQTIDDEVVA